MADTYWQPCEHGNKYGECSFGCILSIRQNSEHVKFEEELEEIIFKIATRAVGLFASKLVEHLGMWSDHLVDKVKGSVVLLLQEELFDPKGPRGFKI